MTEKPNRFQPSDLENPGYLAIADAIASGTKFIMVSGEAGSGKSTFIKEFRDWCRTNNKAVQVLAFTGRAAANIGGRTIHSYLLSTIHPHLPCEDQFDDFKDSLVLHKRKRPTRVNDASLNTPVKGAISFPSILIGNTSYNAVFRNEGELRKLDYLVIDEYSMLRCDVLDMIDIALRWATLKNLPFGGKTVLFFGDTAQLPPVITEKDRKVLEHYYQEPFDHMCADVYKRQPPRVLHLDKVYRQTDPNFIELLRGIRKNGLSTEAADQLNERFVSDQEWRSVSFDTQILCSTNAQCDEYNSQFLEFIQSVACTYKAKVTDEYPINEFPTLETLRLKLGAKVMITQNDAKAGYFNGMIGRVRAMSPKTVSVEVDGRTFEVKPYLWKNYAYSYHKKTRKKSTLVHGTFEQLPIKLAWAITTHKAQGMTFESLMCDLSNEFHRENTYVALSRCTSLNGLHLLSKLNPKVA